MNNRRLTMLAVVAGLSVGWVFGPAEEAEAVESEYRYAIFQIDGFGFGLDIATDVNSHGEVAGQSVLADGSAAHAFLWDQGSILDVGTINGGDSLASGINDASMVAGYSRNADQTHRAFVWTEKDGMIELGTFGGTISKANGINEKGQVTGIANFPGDETGNAFLWEDGVMTDLGRPDGSRSSQGHAINNDGIVAGEYDNVLLGWPRAIVWKNGQMTDLGSFGDGLRRSEANGINDLDQVVGFAKDNNSNNHAFLWENGNLHRLDAGVAKIRSSSANGINNQSQVVGGIDHKNLGALAFAWEPSKGLEIIAELIPPRTRLQVETASGIADNGMISAWGFDEDRENEWEIAAFFLLPVTPELALSDPVPGVAGQKNTWTITNAPPNAKVTLTYSLKGGGTVVPGCDKLDAVLQLDKPKIIKTATADANGEATFRVFVPKGATNLGPILLQAVSVGECVESQLSVFEF